MGNRTALRSVVERASSGVGDAVLVSEAILGAAGSDNSRAGRDAAARSSPAPTSVSSTRARWRLWG